MTEWNEILHEQWYSKEEPEEIVIEFAALLKKRKNRSQRVLDLGCGAGRHTVHMANEGYEAHGIDFAEIGLDLARKRLKQQNLAGHLIKCDMKKLPYVDSCFEALVCLHAIYHQRLDEIRCTVSEIERVLKKTGFILINFLSKRTHSYGKGERVEENTFVEQEGIEKGVVHHFTDKGEIKRLFRNFDIVSLKLCEKKVGGKLRSRWILVAMV